MEKNTETCNILHVTNIDWDSDGFDADLPTEVDIPASMLSDYDNPYNAVEDYLCSVYGYCQRGFCVD